jgi:hypothetical protein
MAFVDSDDREEMLSRFSPAAKSPMPSRPMGGGAPIKPASGGGAEVKLIDWSDWVWIAVVIYIGYRVGQMGYLTESAWISVFGVFLIVVETVQITMRVRDGWKPGPPKQAPTIKRDELTERVRRRVDDD